MVTLHLLKLLENENVGTLAINGWAASIGSKGLYWEDMPLKPDGTDVEGIWIISRQGSTNQRNRNYQPFDIYARFKSPLAGGEKLNNIIEILRESYSDVCELPTIPTVSDAVYYNTVIRPTGSAQNVGLDALNKTVWSMSGEIYYSTKP